MSDSNEAIEPQPELPLDKDNIVDVIGVMDEVMTIKQTQDAIRDAKKNMEGGDIGSDLMDAATALISSRELRIKLMSPDELAIFDALIRKASDKLLVLTTPNDLQEKVCRIACNSMGKEDNG